MITKAFSAIVLIFSLFVAQVSAQKAVSTDKLPPAFFGDFNNSQGEWSLDFERDFVNESRYLPAGGIQSVIEENGVYKFRIKPANPHTPEYSFNAKFLKDTLWISTASSKKYMAYTRIPASDVQYPDIEEFVKKYLGAWYLRDETNKKVAEFFEDHCIINETKYTYNRAINYRNGNTRQMNVSGPDFGRFIHFWGNGNYIGITLLGENAIQLKRDPSFPNQEGIAFADVPSVLRDKWYSTVNEGLELQILPSYHILVGGKSIKMDRLTNNKGGLNVFYTADGQSRSYSFKALNNDYCSITDENQKTVYFKRKSKLKDGIEQAGDKFRGEWFHSNLSDNRLKVADKQLISPDGKIATFGSLLFDGTHYKFYNKKKLIAKAKLLSDDYVEFALPNQTVALYKSSASLPAEAAVTLPDAYLKNWINTLTGKWELSLTPKNLIYKNSFWNYGAVSYKDEKYRLTASKTDTVCYYEDGAEVCVLVKKNASILLGELRGNTLNISIDSVSGNFSSNAQLNRYPVSDTHYSGSKSGDAVLNGQISNLPANLINTPATVIVNDWLFGDQVSYSGKIDSAGRFRIKVPLSGPQSVYFRIRDGLNTNFLTPGDTLMLALDGTKLADNNSVLFMGNNAAINKDMKRVFESAEFRSSRSLAYDEDRNALSLEPEAYKDFRKKLYEKRLNYLNQLGASTTLSAGFKNYYAIEEKVSLYDDLLRYCWLRNSKNREIPVLGNHPTYFNFIDTIDLADTQLRLAGNFQGLVNGILMHYTIYSRPEGKSSITTFGPHTMKPFFKEVLASDTRLTSDERIMIQFLLKATQTEPSADMKHWQETLAANMNWIAPEISKMKNSATSIKMLEMIQRKNPASLKGSYLKLKKVLSAEDVKQAKIAVLMKRNQSIVDRISMQTYLDSGLVRFSGAKHKEFLKRAMVSNGLVSRIESAMEPEVEFMKTKVEQSGLKPQEFAHLLQRYNSFKEDLLKPLPQYASLTQAPEGSADEWLQKIAQKHAGKLVYIDVWAPWCGPCRDELSKSPVMKAAAKDKNVAYVYLCGSGEKKAWEQSIKQYNVDGDHYYVAPGTYQDLLAKFDITGIPRYMLMNTKGQIVAKEAPRPSQVPLLLAEFDKHLK